MACCHGFALTKDTRTSLKQYSQCKIQDLFTFKTSPKTIEPIFKIWEQADCLFMIYKSQSSRENMKITMTQYNQTSKMIIDYNKTPFNINPYLHKNTSPPKMPSNLTATDMPRKISK
jgi:hypothetical protein